jgi:predicted amidophosphoribosyltransferase
MQCPRCQQDAPSDAEFCPECGTKLAAVCAQCGTANASGHKFCKKCGHPLTSAVEAKPEGGRFGSPESYTPRHLVVILRPLALQRVLLGLAAFAVGSCVAAWRF